MTGNYVFADGTVAPACKILGPEELLTQELKNRMFYHSPTPEKAVRHQEIQQAFFELGKKMLELCPEGRALVLALDDLERAKMWSNAAIAQSGTK